MKRPDLPFLRIKRGRGRRVYYYHERFGVRTRLPDIAAPDFLAAYNAAHRGEERQRGNRTFAKLAQSYERSERFQRLAPRTKQDYAKHIAIIVAKAGDRLVARMDRKTVRAMQHANAERPRLANYLVSVMSVLLEHAIDIGWIEHNPAKGARKLKAHGPAVHKEWPPDVRESFEAKASPRARLLYEIAIGTGQRVGDILRMRWSDIRDGAIHLRQGKTGAELVIPLTARLAAHLDAVERRGEYLLSQNLRQTWAYSTLQKEVKAAGGGTIHGLRYTAVGELAALGCTDDEIAAITGHSSRAMVKKYAGTARQIARAKRAQEKRK